MLLEKSPRALLLMFSSRDAGTLPPGFKDLTYLRIVALGRIKMTGMRLCARSYDQHKEETVLLASFAFREVVSARLRNPPMPADLHVQPHVKVSYITPMAKLLRARDLSPWATNAFGAAQHVTQQDGW